MSKIIKHDEFDNNGRCQVAMQAQAAWGHSGLASSGYIDSNFSRHKRGLVADHLTFNRTKPSYPEQYRQQYTPIRLAPATSVFRSRGQLGDALNIIIGSGHHVTGRFFGNSFPTFCALHRRNVRSCRCNGHDAVRYRMLEVRIQHRSAHAAALLCCRRDWRLCCTERGQVTTDTS